MLARKLLMRAENEPGKKELIGGKLAKRQHQQNKGQGICTGRSVDGFGQCFNISPIELLSLTWLRCPS